MKTDLLKKPEWYIVFLIFLTGLGIRLMLAQKNIIFLDRQFIPDDTYYILSLARSFASTHQFSIAGQLTNGFQPLLVFILVLFAYFFHGLSLLHADLVFLGIIDALNILLIAILAHQLFKRSYVCCIAAFFWAISPLAIANFSSGLESSLGLFFTLITLIAWCAAHHSKKNATLYFLLGLSMGFAFLSRVDTAFLIILIGPYVLAREKYALFFVMSVGALLVVLPWWGYELIHFHQIIPESGKAVRFLLTLHQQDDLTTTKAFAFGFASILFAPFFQSYELQLTALNTPLIVLGIAGCFFLFLAILFYKNYKNMTSENNRVILNAIILYGLCIFLFYVFYLPALWFFKRYFEPVFFVMALVTAGFISKGLHTHKNKYTALLYLPPFLLLLSISVLTTYAYYIATPRYTVDKYYFGAKGYAEVAVSILSHLPSGSTLGALQSGALSYFSGDRVTVINLDGVVNSAAETALRTNRLANYARDKKINYISDWPYNIDVFKKQSSLGYPYKLAFLANSKIPQGNTVFALYRITYLTSEHSNFILKK